MNTYFKNLIDFHFIYILHKKYLAANLQQHYHIIDQIADLDLAALISNLFYKYKMRKQAGAKLCQS